MPSPTLRRELLTLVLAAALVPTAALGQPAGQDPSESSSPSSPAAEAPQADQDRGTRRYFDAVTVSATLNEREVREAPGTVSVIDAETIDRELVESIADLVRFEPGVYVETVPGG